MVFSGMGGVRNNNGTLNHIVSSGLYWSSTVSGANIQYLNFSTCGADMTNVPRSNGLSVRCIKD